jgi:hypothetical protein
MMGRLLALATSIALVLACSSTTTVFSSGSSNGSGGSGDGGVGADGGGAAGGEGGGAPACDLEPSAGTLCLRGETRPNGAGEILREGGPVRFEVWPAGCFSSSCTEVIEVGCSVTSAAGSLVIAADFCLADTSDEGQPCTDDCGAVGSAECSIAAVAAGAYDVVLDALSLSFEVPSELPLGGECVSLLTD